MAAQAIAGMVAMAASGWDGQSTYAKEKPASIGINACWLVLVATKIANREVSRRGLLSRF